MCRTRLGPTVTLTLTATATVTLTLTLTQADGRGDVPQRPPFTATPFTAVATWRCALLSRC